MNTKRRENMIPSKQVVNNKEYNAIFHAFTSYMSLFFEVDKKVTGFESKVFCFML